MTDTFEDSTIILEPRLSIGKKKLMLQEQRGFVYQAQVIKDIQY